MVIHSRLLTVVDVQEVVCGAPEVCGDGLVCGATDTPCVWAVTGSGVVASAASVISSHKHSMQSVTNVATAYRE